MKRILCTSIVLIMLLTACSAPAQQVPPTTELSGVYTYGVYELDFSVKRLSGWPFEGWDVVYTYNGEKIQNGHQVLLSVEIFTFYSVQVEVIERDNPENSFTATFPVAICNGGSGKTEITVTGITVVYYGIYEQAYLQLTGPVVKVDPYWHSIQIESVSIDFSEIYELIPC